MAQPEVLRFRTFHLLPVGNLGAAHGAAASCVVRWCCHVVVLYLDCATSLTVRRWTDAAVQVITAGYAAVALTSFTNMTKAPAPLWNELHNVMQLQRDLAGTKHLPVINTWPC